MDWVGRAWGEARRIPEGLGEGWAVFVALWICGSALFLLSFLNLGHDGMQGFIPVPVSAEHLADYGVDEPGSRFRPVGMELIRMAIGDQTDGTQDADEWLRAILSRTQTPIPSIAPVAFGQGQDSAGFAEATPTEEDLAVNTRKPTKTPRPSHTPRPTHTPRDNPAPTNTSGPSLEFSATPSPTEVLAATSTPSSPPRPAVTKRPSKTPKPTKTPKP